VIRSASASPPGATSDASSGTSPGTSPTASIGVVRDARARLSAAARTGAVDVVSTELSAFVVAAWEAGFGYTTIWSIAAAALEEGLPRTRRRPARARAAAWKPCVRDRYRALLGDGALDE
jgi:hypothetical protein